MPQLGNCLIASVYIKCGRSLQDQSPTRGSELLVPWGWPDISRAPFAPPAGATPGAAAHRTQPHRLFLPVFSRLISSATGIFIYDHLAPNSQATSKDLL